MKKELKELHDKIDNLKDNHLSHLANDLTQTKTNVSWLMRFFWIVASASLGALASSLLTLILK